MKIFLAIYLCLFLMACDSPFSDTNASANQSQVQSTGDNSGPCDIECAFVDCETFNYELACGGETVQSGDANGKESLPSKCAILEAIQCG